MFLIISWSFFSHYSALVSVCNGFMNIRQTYMWLQKWVVTSVRICLINGYSLCSDVCYRPDISLLLCHWIIGKSYYSATKYTNLISIFRAFTRLCPFRVKCYLNNSCGQLRTPPCAWVSYKQQAVLANGTKVDLAIRFSSFMSFHTKFIILLTFSEKKMISTLCDWSAFMDIYLCWKSSTCWLFLIDHNNHANIL